MVNLKKEDIKNFELIGQGAFGKIYKCGDKVYKLYRETVKTTYGSLTKNPSLKYKVGRLNRLISLNDKLEHNDLIEDLVFVNGKFKGVIMPYYEGTLLSQTMDMPLEEKIPLAYQIVRNSKELTKHFIYPLDYKLNNMILVGDDVKFLDLDDYHTKVDLFLNPVHKNSCLKGLDETIKTYFYESKTFPLPREIQEKMLRKLEPLNSEYEDIEHYIRKKSERHNYIFIDDMVDLNYNLELLRNNTYRKIYIYKHENIEETVKILLSLGIPLYDLVSVYDLKKYKNSFLYDECLGIKEDRVLKITKT